MKITDRVKTFKDACKVQRVSIWVRLFLFILSIGAMFSREIKAYLAFAKITIILRALNEGWEPDWSNSEPKFYPWFAVSGSGLSCYGYDSTNATTFVGSRLVLRYRDLAMYAGQQFLPLYEDMMIIKKSA